MGKKFFIHINLPRDILRKASMEENFLEGVLRYSSHVKGMIEGLKTNKITPVLSFRMHYFFNWKILYKSKYYKYFFVPYNFFFGFIDNFLLYKLIFIKIKREKIDYYFTELNPTITKSFLKKLNIIGVKSIEWFGLFPSQLGYNSRPNKTLKYFDLIASGENYLPFFKQTPKFFLMIPQAISIKTIDEIKEFTEVEKIDIVFIGSVAKIHSNRWEYLECLFENYKSIEFYGYGIDQVPNKYKFKEKFKTGIWGDDYYKKLKQSKIVINLFQNDYEDLNDGINIRAFEIPACKSLQMSKSLPFISNYFKNNIDIVLFSDKNELKDKIDYYLLNSVKRKKIINNSYRLVQKYDYSSQLKTIINRVHESSVAQEE